MHTLETPARAVVGSARASLLFFAAASLLALAGCGQEGRIRQTTGGQGGDATSSSAGGGEGGAGGGEGGAGQGGGGAGGSGGGPIDNGPLTVVNWNTHNFFNDKTDDPSGLDKPGNATLLSTSEYIAKRKAVADVIHSLSPDIAVLQEIENDKVLGDLKLELEALGSSYPHSILIPTFDIREIAILSKVPFDSTVTHQDEEFVAPGTFAPTYEYTRDCLEAHVTWSGREIVLLGVHFRSKFPPDDAQKRLAEAAHTREIADAIAAKSPEAGILILGDFNDVPGSMPYDAVIGKAPAAYTNASALALPESTRWTFDYMGDLELIDHQMSNPLLAGMLDMASIKIPHNIAVEEASDHAPVVATYNVK